MSEFIYVLENALMPGLVKIGRTERSVSERVGELSSHTGVPTSFTVVKEYAVENSVEAERIIHERLSDYRVADNREFFKMEAEDATDIIESMLEMVRPETRRDFEREDELVARAIPIVVQAGMARPRMLEEMLNISYEEALCVIQNLRIRCVVDEQNKSKLTARSKTSVVSEDSCIALKRPKPMTVASVPMIGDYQLPPMEFLQRADMSKATETKEGLIANAQFVQQTLAQFNIAVSLGDIAKGSTITRYEFHPAPGVKLEEIANLASNLSAALKAEQINILTPVPGESCVGIEVPNFVKTKVVVRELFESEEWRNTKSHIPIALGKNVYGNPIIADLATMPHLLIAGSIGSGKSICIHSIIASLLYRFSPDQLRFVIIDPSAVELQQYNALPHLIVPVVTDTQKALLALRWVMNEMEKRFKIFMRVGASNVKSFNERPKNKPLPMQISELPPVAKKEKNDPCVEGFAVEVDTDEEIIVLREEDIIVPEKLSYVVVIIERLEDLMCVAPVDFEKIIARITQMARPAGIHLILTTRPTNRNILPKTIEAEIPARIAFRCTSRVESRSIIGSTGAEKLLGKGDMLFLPSNSTNLIRAQCANISDQEITSIVNFVARQGRPSYEMEIYQRLSKAATGEIESGIDEDEELIQQCIEVIRNEQKASVPLLQRRLRLGYTRAARMMDELECRGIVGPAKGEEPRDVRIDLDAGDYITPVEQPPAIQPHLVVCLCEHCSEKIEFDANELGDRQSVSVPCPHCGIETVLSP